VVRWGMKRNTALQDAPFRVRAPAAGRKSAPSSKFQSIRVAHPERGFDRVRPRNFDAASIRVIAERTGLQHPLITYHFRTRHPLAAAAEYAFDQILEAWGQVTNSTLDVVA